MLLHIPLLLLYLSCPIDQYASANQIEVQRVGNGTYDLLQRECGGRTTGNRHSHTIACIRKTHLQRRSDHCAITVDNMNGLWGLEGLRDREIEKEGIGCDFPLLNFKSYAFLYTTIISQAFVQVSSFACFSCLLCFFPPHTHPKSPSQ